MDNAVVAGIGNIYAAETLFAAGVDRTRSGDVAYRRPPRRKARLGRPALPDSTGTAGL